MANHTEGWDPGALVRFGSLDIIVTSDGSLEQIQAPVRPTDVDTTIDMLQGLRLRDQEPGAPAASSSDTFDSAHLEHHLPTFLGRHPAQDNLRCTIYSLANVAAQLAGGDPISLDIVATPIAMAFPFGMENMAQRVHHLMVQHGLTHPGGGELVGMVEFVADSDDILLVEDSLLGSGSDSSSRSHHPSRECFVVGTHEGFA